MAVTVPELVVWVVLGLATTGCSKILAFFLCLVFEETSAHLGGNSEPLIGTLPSDSLDAVSAVEDAGAV